MKNIDKLIIVSFLLLSSCSSVKAPISFEGQWYSCRQTSYTTSQLILLTVRGSNFTEEVSQFQNNSGCGGDPVSKATINGAIAFGDTGGSSNDPGGTDVTITPNNSDPFGCGQSAPAYSYWRIQNNSGFWVGTNGYVCDPQNKGQGLGDYYTKYHD